MKDTEMIVLKCNCSYADGCDLQMNLYVEKGKEKTHIAVNRKLLKIEELTLQLNNQRVFFEK